MKEDIKGRGLTGRLRKNRELSVLFHRMADCYRYLGREERFRAIAYETASKTLANMREPLETFGDDIHKLDELKGVGESIASKMLEYLHSGQVASYEKLRRRVPFELLELMDLKGMGPATLRTIHEKLGVNDREQLVEAIQAGRLRGLPGFGERRISHLMDMLKMTKPGERMPFPMALAIGQEVLQAVRNLPGVERAELAGSIRRKKDTVGDIDIIAVAPGNKWKKILRLFSLLPQVKQVKASGQTRASVNWGEPPVQVDLRIVHDYEFGSALFYFTGSKEHNIRIRTLARQQGWKINEYGVFDAETGQRIAGDTEESIYSLLHFSWIPPEERLGTTEFDKYRQEGPVVSG